MEESENVSSREQGADATVAGSIAFGGQDSTTATTYHLPTVRCILTFLLLLISEVDLNT